jgi:N utilization substance protein B
MGKRHLAREIAMKVIFELEQGGSVDTALPYQLEEAQATPDQAAFAGELVAGVLRHREAIDKELSESSTHWSLDQMAKVERAVLRLATYELLFNHDVPPKAAINESIELAKTFGGDEAGRFVNGVLGKVAQKVFASGEPTGG